MKEQPAQTESTNETEPEAPKSDGTKWFDWKKYLPKGLNEFIEDADFHQQMQQP